MDRVRTLGVPMWVTVFTSLLGVMGLVVGVAAMIDPSLFFFTEADDALGHRYAGRMLGLGIVTVGAVLIRSRAMYVLVLLAGIARELGDAVGAATDDESIVLAAATGIVGVMAIAAILRSRVAAPQSGPNSAAQGRSTPTALG